MKLFRTLGCLAMAQRIVFLGFAFHRQNVELLTTPLARIADFRATGHGLAKNARTDVLDRIRTISGKRPPRRAHHQLDENHLVGCKCGKLIYDEQLFLTG